MDFRKSQKLTFWKSRENYEKLWSSGSHKNSHFEVQRKLGKTVDFRGRKNSHYGSPEKVMKNYGLMELAKIHILEEQRKFEKTVDFRKSQKLTFWKSKKR